MMPHSESVGTAHSQIPRLSTQIGMPGGHSPQHCGAPSMVPQGVPKVGLAAADARQRDRLHARFARRTRTVARGCDRIAARPGPGLVRADIAGHQLRTRHTSLIAHGAGRVVTRVDRRASEQQGLRPGGAAVVGQGPEVGRLSCDVACRVATEGAAGKALNQVEALRGQRTDQRNYFCRSE